MAKSREFYEDKLGFHMVSHAMDGDRLYWARLKKDGTQIMLEEGSSEFDVSEDPIKLCFITKDVDRVYSQLLNNGVSVEKPHDAPYGMRQIYLKDPDGHQLWFESPSSEELLKDYTD